MTRLKRSLLVFCAGTICLMAQGSNQGPRPFVIRNVRVFDGEKVMAGATVVVMDGKIASVGKRGSVPKGADVIEGSGKTLLPGLIDSHVHMADGYATSGGTALEQAAAYGITTVLDMGAADPKTYQEFKKKVKAGEYPMGADIFTAGVGATVPNGHGDMRHLNPTITSVEQVPGWLNDRAASGSDYIKIISETFAEHGRNVPTLTDEEFAAVVTEAHKHGLLAVAHTLQQDRATRAVNEGIDVLVHISPYDAPDPAFGKLMAEHHVSQSTNLISYAPPSYKKELSEDPDLAPFMPPFMIADLANSHAFPDAKHEYSMAALKLLTAAHVRILAGTDIGYPYAPMLHTELEIMVKDGGLTPLEALRTATANPADTYRLKDRGRIKPGLRADLLLVEGDPTTNILATRHIATVWRQGLRVDRDAFKARVPSMKPGPRMGPPPSAAPKTTN